MKFYTELLYVDIYTGELIPSYLIKKGDYLKINSQTNYSNEKEYTKKTITTSVKRSQQLKLEF